MPRPLLLAVVACLLPQLAGAVELLDGKLSLNGYGNWSVGVSKGPNAFEFAGPGGTYDQGEFALSAFAKLTEDIVVGAQVRFAPDEKGVGLEWAFAEYRVNDMLHFRIGKVKHPFGLFGEVQRVGTLRVFANLPLSVYGPTELVADGVLGISLSGILYDNNDWTLRYDVYGGAFDASQTEPYDKLLDPSSLAPGAGITETSETSTNAVGARLSLSTPVEGLGVMVSGYAVPSNETDHKGVRWVVGPSAYYVTEKWALRAEWFWHRDYDLALSWGGYLEAARFVTQRLQVGLRGEVFQTTLYGFSGGSSLLYHRDATALVAWWFNPGFAIKLEGHLTDGNRFAQPAALDDALLAGNLKTGTLAAVLSAQFSY